MLIRSLRIPPSLLLLLIFLAFFGWQLSQGPNHEEHSLASALTGTEKKAPRIAIMTFVTDQRSYLHISLKNKDRKLYATLSLVVTIADKTCRQTMCAATAMI